MLTTSRLKKTTSAKHIHFRFRFLFSTLISTLFHLPFAVSTFTTTPSNSPCWSSSGGGLIVVWSSRLSWLSSCWLYGSYFSHRPGRCLVVLFVFLFVLVVLVVVVVAFVVIWSSISSPLVLSLVVVWLSFGRWLLVV